MTISAAQNHALSVTVAGVSKIFPGNVAAIAPMDLSIPAGEFISIIGPSGCGKSTLLRLIAGLDKPTTGTIRTVAAHEDRDSRIEYAGSYSKSDVAYVFQDAHLLPWRNVLRNVALPLELMHVEKSRRVDAALAAIEQVGLSDAVKRYPAQLSGGMRMRVSLARALVTNPKLLLLDEPFAALDEINRQKLDDLLREIWLARKMTTIFVTHSLQEAAFLARRAVVFSNRPAKILLDRTLELPEIRSAELRTDQAFARETRALFQALQQAGG
jgi:NitT/TauT family transport system ATP-binding protein